MAEWLKSVEKWLVTSWGLNSNFAIQIARFLAYCSLYRLNPVVTSGWRDPARQAALRAAWDRGDRQGLRARPALSSQHTVTSSGFMSKSGAALAVDIDTSDDHQAAHIARQLGIGVGLDFRDPDPGHYFAKGL